MFTLTAMEFCLATNKLSMECLNKLSALILIYESSHPLEILWGEKFLPQIKCCCQCFIHNHT